MNTSSTLLLLPGPPVCQHCGAVLATEDPLGGGVCEACLWKELTAQTSGGSLAYQHLVEGHDILEELGRGGMGVVYRAHQHSPGRDVALKMLLPLESGHSELRERFQQEARALADLDHPAILPLFQVGEADGLPYFTMKLASGGTLAHRLKLEGRWLPRRAGELITVLADGIHYAHQRGVIHRDIKPGNILFDDAGRAYVADFGLAKLEDGASSFTRSAGIMGTPSYLAPEIPTSGARAATISSDVYGLGAVLYELLAGRPPFVVEGLAALLKKIAEEEPESPSTIHSRVPRDLEIICLKCLRKTPRDRYASAAALADDLRRWLRGEPILARQITPLQRLGKWARRRPALASLSAALVLLATGSALWLAWSNRQLNLAIARALEAQANADQRAEFLLGSFADSLEAVGRLELLNAAYADVLKTDTGTDGPSRIRRTKLLTRWGSALRLQGRNLEAQSALRRSAKEAASLPVTPESALLRAKAETELALAIADTESIEKPLQILEGVQKSLEENPSRLRASGLLEARGITASALARLGIETSPHSSGVRECASEATALWREWLAAAPDDRSRQFALAKALQDEAVCFVLAAEQAMSAGKDGSGDWATSDNLYEEALFIVEKAHAAAPADAGWNRELATLHRARGSSILSRDPTRWREALPQLESARERLETLVRSDPLDWRSQLEASASLYHLAKAAKAAGDDEKYDDYQHRQEVIVAELHRQAPEVKQWALARMNNSIQLAQWHLERSRPREAEAHFDNAWQAGQATLSRRLEQSADQEGFAQLTIDIAKVWRDSGKLAEAEASLIKGITVLRSHEAAGPAGEWCQWMEAKLRRRLAEFLEAQKRFPEALTCNLEAMKLRAGLLRAGARAAQRDPGAVPHGYLESERSLITLQRVEEAVELARGAMQLRRACAGIAGKSEPWAEAVIAAAKAGIAAGGKLAPEAQSLAGQALIDLFGAAAAEPGKAGEGESWAIAELRRLAGDSLPVATSQSQ